MMELIDKIFTIPCDREYYGIWAFHLTFYVIIPLFYVLEILLHASKYAQAKSANNLYISNGVFRCLLLFIIPSIHYILQFISEIHYSTGVDHPLQYLGICIFFLLLYLAASYLDINYHIFGLNNHNSKGAIKDALTQLGVKYRWDDIDPSIKPDQTISVIEDASILKVYFRKNYCIITSSIREDNALLKRIINQLKNTKYANMPNFSSIISKRILLYIFIYFLFVITITFILFDEAPFSYLSDDSSTLKTGVQYFGI